MSYPTDELDAHLGFKDRLVPCAAPGCTSLAGEPTFGCQCDGIGLMCTWCKKSSNECDCEPPEL